MSRIARPDERTDRQNVENERLIPSPAEADTLAETSAEDVLPNASLSTSSHSLGGARRREPAQKSVPVPAQLRPLSISPSPSPNRREAISEEDGHGSGTPTKPARDEPVTWSSLPRKGQLTILALARLSEPLTQTSLQSYLYYQLQSFDSSLSPSQISSQAGFVVAAFAAAQAVTAVFWGTVADATWGGRKFVIIIGLCGTGLGSLGYGFSGSWKAAVAWRLVSGGLNGNIGVMRTMISEIVKEKKYQSRAFLLLPMCFNVGVIIGPLMGGLLADPIGSYPNVFGPGSKLGGEDGVWWMKRWPYSLPNTVSSVYLITAAVMVWLGMEETHEGLRDRPDLGIRLGHALKRILLRIFGRRSHDYSQIPANENEELFGHTDLEAHSAPTTPATPLTPMGRKVAAAVPKRKLPFRRLWTRNVIWTLLSHFILAMGVGTFNALWFLFLSTPRWDPAHPRPSWLTKPSPPLFFSGGLGLPPARIGAAMAVLGAMGITLQLVLYPRVATRLGTLRALQASVPLFPIVYLAVPYLALVPSSGDPPPTPAEGVRVWAAIAAVLAVQVLARTFALPATAILVNNASPHPSVLGTVHGLAQSFSSASRTLSAVAAGWVFGRGLDMGVVGLAFWIMAGITTVEVGVTWLLREGDGHEIWLEGEKEEMEEQEQEEHEQERERGHEQRRERESRSAN